MLLKSNSFCFTQITKNRNYRQKKVKAYQGVNDTWNDAQWQVVLIPDGPHPGKSRYFAQLALKFEPSPTQLWYFWRK